MRHLGINRRFPPGPLLKSVEEVTEGLEPEEVVPVRTARVALADYGAILHDFAYLGGAAFRERYRGHFCPSCLERGQVCEDAIDAWLLANAAFVSAQQARPNGVNAPIEHGPPVPRGYRPPFYGRALVIPIEEGAGEGAGLLDIKGAGVAPGVEPQAEVHFDGLEYLGNALADYFYGWLVDRIFERTVPSYWTVPIYAVIDLGFDIVDGAHGTAPAGLHVRRAHARPGFGTLPPMSGADQERIQLHIDLMLRAFGISSTTIANSAGLERGADGKPLVRRGTGIVQTGFEGKQLARFEALFERVNTRRVAFTNIQIAKPHSWEERSAQLVDFGHFGVGRKFHLPIATRVLDAFFNMGRVIVPEDEAYTQPRRAVALDPDLFNRTVVGALAFQAAFDFRSDRLGRRELRLMLAKGMRRTGL